MLGHEAGGLVLLDDMRQLVGQEVGSLGAIGREFAGSEDDVTADRERPGLDGRRRGRRAGIGVHADPAEIAPEPGVERRAHRSTQRHAGRAKHLPYQGRDRPVLPDPAGITWQPRHALLLTLRARANACVVSSAGTGAVHDAGLVRRRLGRLLGKMGCGSRHGTIPLD